MPFQSKVLLCTEIWTHKETLLSCSVLTTISKLLALPGEETGNTFVAVRSMMLAGLFHYPSLTPKFQACAISNCVRNCEAQRFRNKSNVFSNADNVFQSLYQYQMQLWSLSAPFFTNCLHSCCHWHSHEWVNTVKCNFLTQFHGWSQYVLLDKLFILVLWLSLPESRFSSAGNDPISD